MLSSDKQNLAVAFPMQVAPWERRMPSCKKDKRVYYEDLACRIKIAVFLGVMLTIAMLWAKMSSGRAESQSFDFMSETDAFYTNLNSDTPSIWPLAPLFSDDDIPQLFHD